MRNFALPMTPLIVLAVLVNATAQEPDLMVDLRFVPQEGVTAGSVALPPSLVERPVNIRVEDARVATDPEIIGSATDDDDRPFAIRTTTDVRQFVDNAVAQLASAQALQTGSTGDRTLVLRVTRFHVNEVNRALGSTYAAEVHLSYALRDGEGRTLSEGAAAGSANRYGRAGSGENCAEVLSDALKEAWVETMSNQALQSAWASGRATPPVRGQAGEQPSPGARTLEERLKILDDLRERGLISPEEHRVRRAEILREI